MTVPGERGGGVPDGGSLMPEWTTLDRSAPRISPEPFVRFGDAGRLHLSHGGWKLLGEPAQVALAIAARENLIGIQKCAPAKSAFPVTATARGHHFSVAAGAIWKALGRIPPPETGRRYPLTKDGDWYVIDLNARAMSDGEPA